MNTKKVIGYLMMQTLEAVWKAEESLKEFINDMDLPEDEDDRLQIISVNLQNIKYYAKMIIENEDAL